MTPEEAAAAIQAALAENNQSARYEALLRIARAIAIADVPKALLLADGIANRDLKANFVSTSSRAGGVGPGGRHHLRPRPHKVQERDQIVGSTLNVWRNTMSRLPCLVPTAPACSLRNQATWKIVSAMAQENPRGALDLMRTLPTVFNRQNLYDTVFNQWANTDPPRRPSPPSSSNRVRIVKTSFETSLRNGRPRMRMQPPRGPGVCRGQ